MSYSPRAFEGTRIIQGSSGPTASQSAAQQRIEGLRRRPEWTSEAVAKKLEPNRDALAQANSAYEELREATCDMAYGGGGDGGGSIGPDGKPDSSIDEIASLTGGSSDWQRNAAAWCQPLPDFAVTPTTVKPKKWMKAERKEEKSPTRLSFSLQASEGRAYEVATRKAQVAAFDKKLAVTQEADRQLAPQEKVAEKKLKEAPPREKEQKKSMLEEIRAMRRDNAQKIEVTEEKRREAVQELKKAETDLAQTRSEAKKALADDRKFQDFYRKNKSFAGRRPSQAFEPKPEGLPPSAEDPAIKEYVPSLRIWRPSSDEVDFIVEVKKRFGEDDIPYPEAKVKVSWEAMIFEGVSDPLGRIPLSPRMVAGDWPAGTHRLKLTASMGQAEHQLVVTRQEIDHYLKSGAELLARQGDEAFGKNQFDEAARKYWDSLNWTASDKASKGWLANLEKLGGGHSLLQAYRVALAKHVKDPGERAALKEQAISTARSLKPPPPIPPSAVEQHKKGQEAFAAGKESDTLLQFEVASSIAPWWHDPYYAQAQVFQQLSFQKSFYFAQAAIQNYDLFLKAAPADDPRMADARKERKDLAELLQAMNQ